jgi:hypothetical protein
MTRWLLRLFSSGAAALAPGVALAAAASGVFDVRDFGAVGDGRTLCTAALNRAVEAAAGRGGGTVLVPAGRYLTGTVYLKSNVTVELGPGSVVAGSTSLADYPENPPPVPVDTVAFRRLRPRYPEALEYGRFAIFSAAGQDRVRITGTGTIEGNGDHPNFSKRELVARGLSRQEAHARRPFGLSFVRCREVRVDGVAFRNLASWTQSYLDCDGVQVEGVSVDSAGEDRNNDGIDLDGCRNFRVTGCRFNTGDDAICLKSSFAMCENGVIAGCVIRSRVNAVKFGTASLVGFRTIAIANLVVESAGAAGLALEIVDGGVLEDVVASNLTLHEVGAAFFIRLGDRGRQWMRPDDHVVGVLRRVLIENVTASTVQPFAGNPFASSISGLAGHPVEDVRIRGLRLVPQKGYPRDGAHALLAAAVLESETDYPEFGMFGPLPASGVFVRHARDIVLDDVRVTPTAPEYRPTLYCQDVSGLRVNGLAAPVQPDGEAVVVLRDVNLAAFVGCRAPAGAPTYLRIEGASSEVTLSGVDLAGARQGVVLAPGLLPSTVRDLGLPQP